jgi:hypothetical protein
LEDFIATHGIFHKQRLYVTGDTLYITGTGAMQDYSEDSPAPWNEESFAPVVIQEGVTTIGDSAFMLVTR